MSERQARGHELPGAPVRFVVGAALGALAALAFAGWEAALLGWLRAGVPDPQAGLSVLGAYATLGAGIGGISGGLGAWGGRWAFASSLLAGGWLLSGKAAVAVSGAGAPGVLGVLLVLGLALVVGQIAARTPLPRPVALGLGAGLWVWLALAVPLHLHLLPASDDTLGVVVSLVSGLAGLFAGALVGVSASSEDRAPALPIVVAALVGWGAAAPVLTRVSEPWEPGEAQTPGVLLVLVDGLRHDRLGLGGYDRPTSPHLDRFARQAQTFREAHATSNWPVPSLASVLTGRLPYGHGAGAHHGARPGRGRLRLDVVGLPAWLGRQGVKSALVTGDPGLLTYGLDAGFHHVDHLPPEGPLPAGLHPVLAAGLSIFPTRRSAREVTDRALALLETRQEGGWLLVAHYVDPGDPFLYERDSLDAVGRTLRAPPADAYEAAVHTVDAQVARLLEAVGPEVIVVIAGTHGLEVSEGRSRRAGVPRSARHGHALHQEQIHVPLLIRAGRAGSVTRPVSLVDLGPTVLALLDLPALPRAEGEALPEALGRAAPREPRPVVAQSVRYGPEQQVVRVGSSKLMRTQGGRETLFDLATDPHETTGVRQSGETSQLARKLATHLPPHGAGVSLSEPIPITANLGALAARALP